MRIVILDDFQEVALGSADWSALPVDWEIDVQREHIGSRAELVRRLLGAQVVVAMRERTPFPAAVLGELDDLELLVTTGMVNASIDLDAAVRHGVTVCGTRMLSRQTVELVWALIMATMRGLVDEDRAVRDGSWQALIGREIAGATLGVVGLGRLGREVARIGQFFGMRVIAWSQNLDPLHAAEVGVEAVTQLRELCRLSDVVSIHLRLSDRTRGLIGAEELRALGPRGHLVNTSRGPIVDEDALVRALHDGVIAGAALDVFDQEPLPADHPLLGAPGTILSPHKGFVAERAYAVAYGDVVEDIIAWHAGEPVRVLAGP